MDAVHIRIDAAQGRVLHLLGGRLTEEVFGLLGPATTALSRSLVTQAIVLVDHPQDRPTLARFDAAVERVRVAPQRDPLAQWRGLRSAFQRALTERPLKAVHLHGYVACLLAEPLLSKLSDELPVLYSPHGSRSLGSLRGVARMVGSVARPVLRTRASFALGNGEPEVQALQAMAHPAVRLLEGPVDDAYFAVRARPALQPLIVTATHSRSARGVEAFDRLAVLLGGEALQMGFHRIGPADAVAQARLAAAKVSVFDVSDDAERAALLLPAWVFLALAGGRGFPLCLAQAMAVGLPCVALDTPHHRDLVRHGETGYLCREQAEVIDRIAQLVDTPSLRERLGASARALARERFGAARFQDALLAAYELCPVPPNRVSVATRTRPLGLSQETQ